jgi:hypothetical protein
VVNEVFEASFFPVGTTTFHGTVDRRRSPFGLLIDLDAVIAVID